MTMVTDFSTSVCALFPFNKDDADVVLRSSDDTLFRVRSHILIEASPIFQSMLSTHSESTFTIDIDADAETLDALLRICYPIPRPKIDRTMDQIECLLRTATKYQLVLPISSLEEDLVEIARHGKASEVYGLACRMKLEDLARGVLDCTLDIGNFDMAILAHVGGLTAGHIFRLQQYRQLRGQVPPVFSLLPIGPDHSKNDDAEWYLVRPEAEAPTSLFSYEAEASESSWQAQSATVPSFIPMKLLTPDLTLLSSDGKSFLTHRHVISDASLVLQIAIAGAPRIASRTKTKKGGKGSSTHELPSISSIRLNERSDVLLTLFSLCYSSEGRNPLPTSSPAHLLAVLAAAKRLGMHRILDVLAPSWESIVLQEPLPAYFAAVREGLPDHAKQAARHALKCRLDDQYLPEMETTPVLPYLRILAYYDNYRANVKARIRKAYATSIVASAPASPESGVVRSPDDDLYVNAPTSSSTADAPRINTNVDEHVEDVPAHTDVDTEKWLQDCMDELCDEVENQPGELPSANPEWLFQRASVERRWCSSCNKLANRLSHIAKALRELPETVEEMQMEL